ncbi:MAG TPA: TerB family tellurite resistance protein [Ohtaekwangia sp.]
MAIFDIQVLVEMDIVTKKQLNVLIQLAEADKHFAKIEREMIFKIARDRKFPEEVVMDLIRNPEPIDSLGALSLDQKFEYLMSSIELVFVDQNVFESEIIFSKNIAIKLGFKKGVIDYFVENYGQKSREEFKEIAVKEFI